ncbi:MAG: ATP-binding cassette domain-containing protein [Actinophytocola sp.]|uniref:ABC transporter ATP-binding protein n=1 Tax=Actinophytocola sp. TaxID=1872138 RepID=UPI001328D4EC|nr:ABC transporter ATP-binding protein [Actinophytocola sp.]MPZ79727.1 ATP-binding cassette domain-containing protein [Actinophytocola sp.]
MSELNLEWRAVDKSFTKDDAEVEVLRNVNLGVKEGEFVSLLGPSGCGKSTLLNLAAGLLSPEGGSVYYRGNPITAINTQVAYLTQKDTLLPWRTVWDNTELPLQIQRVPKAERAARIREQIDRVGLTGFEKHYPRELSGGMRKRAALIRTLIYDPTTLLMDEPFGALDAQLKAVMQQELLRIWSGSGKTVVFVTHDLREAIALSDRVIVISGRPGTVKLEMDVPIPRPRNVVELGLESGEPQRLAHELWEALRADVEVVERKALR